MGSKTVRWVRPFPSAPKAQHPQANGLGCRPMHGTAARGPSQTPGRVLQRRPHTGPALMTSPCHLAVSLVLATTLHAAPSDRSMNQSSDFKPRHSFAGQATIDQAAAAAVPDQAGFDTRLLPEPVRAAAGTTPADSPKALPDPGEAIYRVDCGAVPAADRQPTPECAGWLPDRVRGDGGTYGAIGGSSRRRGSYLAFSGRLPQEIYRTERYGMSAYEFDLPDGTYTVRLHFAEGFECAYQPGFRVFDVSVQGRPAIAGMDPFAAGGGLGWASAFDVTGARVDHRPLTIGFADKANKAMINAIEVFQGRPDDAWGTEQLVGPVTRELIKPTPGAQLCRVLHIGNSHTFFWDIPHSAAMMVNGSQRQVWLEPYRYLHGGYCLQRYFDPKGDPAQGWQKAIEAGQYDFIVLQDSIAGYQPKGQTIAQWREAMGNIRRVAAVARAAGSRTILYLMDDPADWQPGEESQAELLKVAREEQFLVIPARPALKALMADEKANPHGLVFENDGVHLGVHGACLVACLHYIAWTGRTPAGNPSPFLVGQELPVEPAIARRIGEFAWKFSSDYAKRHRIHPGIFSL